MLLKPLEEALTIGRSLHSDIPMRNRDVHAVAPESFEGGKNSAAGNTARPRRKRG